MSLFNKHRLTASAATINAIVAAVVAVLTILQLSSAYEVHVCTFMHFILQFNQCGMHCTLQALIYPQIFIRTRGERMIICKPCIAYVHVSHTVACVVLLSL